MKKINIIIPIFNEEESIAELVQKIKETSLKIKEDIVITMVDDGSSDKSWEIIQNISDSVLSFRKLSFLGTLATNQQFFVVRAFSRRCCNNN